MDPVDLYMHFIDNYSIGLKFFKMDGDQNEDDSLYIRVSLQIYHGPSDIVKLARAIGFHFKIPLFQIDLKTIKMPDLFLIDL